MLDLEKYTAKFLAECGENIEKIGKSLALMRAGKAVQDDLETAHRASHSIKGAARIFGYDRIAGLAEEIELVLYHVWKGRLVASSDVLTALGTGKEQLLQLLESQKTGAQLPDSSEHAAVLALRAAVAGLEPRD
jgi:chemotaxis protein histidine kinase CheA